MDEQEKRPTNTQETPSEGGNKRRSSRRRNRKRKGNQSEAEAQAQQPEVQAQVQSQSEMRERLTRGNAAKPKRRNNPRRSAMPDMNAPAVVVRNNAPQIAPLQPMRLRKIDPEDNSEPIVGCPMLTRTRLQIPFRGNQRVARCSVGWSVHDEDEVMLCMHTPTAAQCWKDNPEQLAELVERLRPQIEAELAAGE